MPEPNHEDKQQIVIDTIDNPVVADPNTVQIFAARERLDSFGTRIVAKRVGTAHDPSLNINR